MARQKLETVINMEDAAVPSMPVLAEALHQLDTEQHQHEVTVRAIARQIGYDLPADCIDPDLIQRDISRKMHLSVEACLDVGRGLTVLKATCEHGNFIARLDVLGIDRKVSAKFMASARKFANVSSNATFEKAIGSQTKLFEMLILDDEQIEELELTGQTGELKLDDVATMSVKELRVALRKAKQEAEAIDRVLADKNAVNDKLAMQLNAREQRVVQKNPDEIAKELRSQANVDSFEAEHAIANKLAATFKALTEHSLDNGGEHRQFMLGLVTQIERELIKVRQDFNLTGEISTDDTPDWAKPEWAEEEKKINAMYQAEWDKKMHSPEWENHPAAIAHKANKLNESAS